MHVLISALNTLNGDTVSGCVEDQVNSAMSCGKQITKNTIVESCEICGFENVTVV